MQPPKSVFGVNGCQMRDRWPWAGALGAAGLALGLTVSTGPALAQGSRSGAGEGWSAIIAPKNTPGPASLPPAPRAAPPNALLPLSPELSDTSSRARVLLELTGNATVSVFYLSDPWRVVADLSNAELVRPVGAVPKADGLITGLRAGLFAPGKLRVVMDTSGPVNIETARILAATASAPARLEIVVVAGAGAASRASELAAAAHSLPTTAAEPSPAAVPAPRRDKPVIVIDPGHGGIDPGARGEVGVEKDIVLAVAGVIAKALRATKRYDVVMTRTSDVFIPLDQRVQMSRQRNADLFLSIHADSLDAKAQARLVRGATIYTLSDTASDARAQAMADKENASDLLAGLPGRPGGDDTLVRDILVDLMRRESADLSADFRHVLVGEMRPKLTLARDPFRSAPFRVLRQSGSPAVLIELGYISNATDEKLMLSQPWQRTFALSITSAIETYFAKRPVTAR